MSVSSRILNAHIYGTVASEFLSSVTPGAGPGWIDKSEDHWKGWLKGVKAVLETTLWPAAAGIGKDTYPSERVWELTLADFECLHAIQMHVARLGGATAQSISDRVAAARFDTSQATVFESFERENNWEDYVSRYNDKGEREFRACRMMASYLRSYGSASGGTIFGPFASDDAMFEAGDKTFGAAIEACGRGVIHDLKSYFQRPRPFQLAEQFEQRNFYHWLSYSANSPALPGGHALEGALACAAIAIDRLRNSSDKAAINFYRYCAGYGDRRVFAGLHFPSDHLASFLVAAKLLPELYSNERLSQAKEHLRKLLSYSVVYLTLTNRITEISPSPIYRPAIARLEEILRD
jgi:hypothetical protein